MTEEVEGRIRSRLREVGLPAAPGGLRTRVALTMKPALTEPEDEQPPSSHRRGQRSRNRVLPLLAAAALVAALVGTSLLGPGAPPPTVVDGLPVMTVSQVLNARAAGGLHEQPVAVGGYWTNAEIGHSCTVGQRSELEDMCHASEYGMTELNEPVLKFGRFNQIVYEALGPHMTPYLPRDLAMVDQLFGLPLVDRERYPPVPIVVIGHFNDPLADRCQPDNRQACRDRLVADRIAYFNPGLARWAEGIPTIEPSDPPAPSHY